MTIRNQKGVVSILTAVFFSILIMTVTVSTLVVQTKELRQSTDTDQSVRAYYAAQSGLERGLQLVKENGGNFRGENCGAVKDPRITLPDLGLNSGLEITCIKISDANVGGSNTLNQEQATQFDLSAHARVDEAIFRWGESLSGSESWGAAKAQPTAATWNLPALIEMTVYSFPVASSGIKPSDIEARTILLKPHNTGTNSVNIGPAASGQDLQVIKCTNGTTYACSVSITGFPTTIGVNKPARHVVRFRPRYAGTTYAISFKGGGLDLSSATGGVQIDVTARAGDVFRRLIAVSEGYGQPLQYGLDYAILSQRSVCKDMTVNTSGRASDTCGAIDIPDPIDGELTEPE